MNAIIMMNRFKIPQALINLKASSGMNWRSAKTQFTRFLDTKRELENSSLNVQLKNHCERLIYKETIKNYWFSGNFDYKQCSMTKEEIISHARNVLSSLYKLKYDSKLVCYIKDGYNTCTSGNKKYPQFD
jgi:hypothetical protein